MARMETKVLKRGVRYRVLDSNLEIAWEQVVMFGQGMNRPGGKAFTDAARKQEQIAKQFKQAEDGK